MIDTQNRPLGGGIRPSRDDGRETQKPFWDAFWRAAPSISVDRVSLARKLEKQGGRICRAIDLNGRKVLDVGCGMAFIDAYLVDRADCEIMATDFRVDQIQVSQHARERLRCIAADGLALPFNEREFDVVLAVEMLHHLDPHNVIPALSEMCRVLKPGGALFSIEPNRWHPLIVALSIFDPSERNQLTLSISRIADFLRPRFESIQLQPINYFLPTYKYRPPPLVEWMRPLVERLEDWTEHRYLCMEYLIQARGFRG